MWALESSPGEFCQPALAMPVLADAKSAPPRILARIRSRSPILFPLRDADQRDTMPFA